MRSVKNRHVYESAPLPGGTIITHYIDTGYFSQKSYPVRLLLSLCSFHPVSWLLPNRSGHSF